jgi:hypothetical protein
MRTTFKPAFKSSFRHRFSHIGKKMKGMITPFSISYLPGESVHHFLTRKKKKPNTLCINWEMKIHRLLTLAFICLLPTVISAQKIEQSLQKLFAEYRGEKIYLHLDKQAYLENETIWFKAYIFSGNFPSQISNVLYIDLISAEGKIIQQQTLPVIQSGASGALQLPEKTSGAVTIRAYTKWMLNFDETQLYTRTVPVFSSTASSTKPVSIGGSSVIQKDLAFYPEGGTLIHGIETTIAFRGVNKDGEPLNISGKICTAAGDSITSFSSVHNGIGSFILKPAAAKYIAVWKKDGQTIQTPLPPVQTSGIVINVKEQANALIFTIKRREDDNSHTSVILAAQMNQQLLYKAPVDLKNTNEISGRIPIKGLPSGVIQLTVFSKDYRPLAERLFFGGAESFSSQIKANIPDTYNGQRKALQLELEIPDTIISNLSVSITDASIPSHIQQQHMPASLLLSSDLKGDLYHPDLYFSGNKDALPFLDLVMMTHQWQGFNWDDILAGKYPDIKNTPDITLSAKGRLSPRITQAHPGNNVELILKPTGGNIKMLTVPFDANGNITLNDLFFHDSAAIYIKPSRKKAAEIVRKNDITISTNLSEFQTPAVKMNAERSTPDSSLVRAHKEYEKWMSEVGYAKATTLQGVTVAGKKESEKTRIDKQYSTGMFTGGERDRIILPEDDPAFLTSINLYDYLRTREPGLRINPQASENPIEWRGSPTALFVDEISQQTVSGDNKIAEDATLIASLQMSDIAMVKIFPPPFAGAWGGGPGGAIAVYLKKGARGKRAGNEVPEVWLKGFSQVKQFTSPDYSKESSATMEPASTLLWAPFIILGKGRQKMTIPFNTGNAKDLRVVIEGCNEDGQLIRIERIIRAQ